MKVRVAVLAGITMVGLLVGWSVSGRRSGKRLPSESPTVATYHQSAVTDSRPDRPGPLRAFPAVPPPAERPSASADPAVVRANVEAAARGLLAGVIPAGTPPLTEADLAFAKDREAFERRIWKETGEELGLSTKDRERLNAVVDEFESSKWEIARHPKYGERDERIVGVTSKLQDNLRETMGERYQEFMAKQMEVQRRIAAEREEARRRARGEATKN